MKQSIVENGITYELCGEQYYPIFETSKETNYYIAKYGSMRLAFIKEHRKGTYTTLLTQFKLNEHLHTVDVQAKEQVRMMTVQLAHSRGINEALNIKSFFIKKISILSAISEAIIGELFVITSQNKLSVEQSSAFATEKVSTPNFVFVHIGLLLTDRGRVLELRNKKFVVNSEPDCRASDCRRQIRNYQRTPTGVRLPGVGNRNRSGNHQRL